MKSIKYSLNNDIKVLDLKDVIPEKMIKIFPYELPNTKKSDAFIQDRSVSIASISQKDLDTDNEMLQPFYYKIDTLGEIHEVENNDADNDILVAYYFELFAAVISSGTLDFASSTSVYGQELKEEDSFTALSNWYYEGELESIKAGNLRFIPAVFSIGLPYSKTKYTNGDIAMFITPSMIEAKEGRAQYQIDELETEGLYEFQLVNITSIESSFTNARVIFTTIIEQNFTNTNEIFNIQMQPGTFLQYIKAKGTYKKASGGFNRNGFIDLYTNSNLTPIKATPSAVQDNIELYIDWFNYDFVMPWVYAEKFNPSGILSEIMGNIEDVKLIHDMLYLTAAFANHFSDAPRYSVDQAQGAGGGAKAGDIRGDAEVANTGLKYVALENTTATNAVDSLYESHIRNYPDFNLNDTRKRNVKMVISSLSRYISSEYAIGGGNNSFNQVFLPWYLEPNESINYSAPKNSLEFTLRTNYFKDNFNSADDYSKASDLKLPKNFRLSNQIYLKADAPISLPVLPYEISALSKFSVAGNIDLKTDNALKYLFFIPIENINDAQKMYINSEAAIVSSSKSEKLPYSGWVVRNVDSYTGTDAVTHIEQTYPGWEPLSIPVVTASTTIENVYEYATGTKGGPTMNPNIPDEYNWKYKWPDGKNAGTSVGVHPNYPSRQKQTTINVFTIASGTRIKTTSGSVTNYSIDKRRITFNKEEWYNFINDFDIKSDNNSISINKDNDISIIRINEIIIGQIFGDSIGIKMGADSFVNVPLFNADDETIGTQKIIFT